ncbi:MAG: hypothetical protein QOD61_1319 [Solirubrobacteraceae bacterium]|nr:hypothetical protein [Solirubrobacteraceae bacterium]
MTPDRVPPAPDDAGTGPTAADQVHAAADDPGQTTRERTGRFALGAYPLDARRARGEEMLGTLLDASDGSVGRFGREIGGLVRAGLGERATRVAGAGARRLIADGFCLAGVWAMTLDLSVLLAQRVRGEQDALLAPVSIALLGLALAVALVGHDRLAGAGVLAWTALRMPGLVDHHPGLARLAASEIPGLVVYSVMLVAPRRRRPNVRRLGWLAVPAGLVAVFGSPSISDHAGPIELGLLGIPALALVATAAAMLSTDPRLAIAGAVWATSLGFGVALRIPRTSAAAAALLITLAPAVVAFAVVRTRRLQRRAAIP